MKRIKRILVPTDFSDNAQNALEYAIHFSKDSGAKLVLYHAYHLPVSIVGAAYPYNSPYVEEMEQEIKEKFSQLEENYLKGSKVNYNIITQMGLFADRVEEVIKENEIDLVIMGTHGGGAMEELLGSTTTDMFRRSRIPVIAVPEDIKFKKPKNILFATDYHFEGAVSFEMLIELAELFGAEIHVLNIFKEGEKLDQTDRLSGIILDKYLHNIKHSFHVASGEDIGEKINEYVDDHDIDLLAMMPKKHNIFERVFKGSLTKKMAFHSKIPLLAFHE